MRSHTQANSSRRSASQPPGRRAHPRQDPEDLYSVLDVTRDATVEDIRRAYKKMALKWHPDKNADSREFAADMFKKVSHAYEVLSKPETRQLYDMGGMAAVNGEVPVTPHEPFEGASGFDFARGSEGFHFEPHFSPPHGHRHAAGAAGAGRHRQAAHPFMFHDPFEVFRQFFDFADDGYMGHLGEDDGFARRGGGARRPQPFGQMRGSLFDDHFGFGMMGLGGLGLGLAGRGGGRSLFAHDLFSDGGFSLGGGNGSTVMMSSSFGGGLGAGESKSVSSSTVIQNGQRVTRTVTRTVDRHGNVHEDVDESIQELPSTGGGSASRITSGTRIPRHSQLR